jgi:hypothetical protein
MNFCAVYVAVIQLGRAAAAGVTLLFDPPQPQTHCTLSFLQVMPSTCRQAYTWLVIVKQQRNKTAAA